MTTSQTDKANEVNSDHKPDRQGRRDKQRSQARRKRQGTQAHSDHKPAKTKRHLAIVGQGILKEDLYSNNID